MSLLKGPHSDKLECSVFDLMSDGILVADWATGEIAYLNEQARDLFGLSKDEAAITLPDILPHYADLPADAPASTDEWLTWKVGVPIRLKGRTRAGRELELLVTITRIDTSDNERLCLLRLPAEKADTQAPEGAAPLYDALTGLPNRELCQDRLEQAINQAKRYDWRVAAVSLELDQFKLINQTLGHEYGDVLLKLVADRLRRCLRKYDTVARLCGDEFLVLIVDVQTEELLQRALSRIQNALKEPFSLGENEVMVSATMGVSQYPDNGDSHKDLIKYACVAREHAKQQLMLYQIYRSEMSPPPVRNLRMKTLLSTAIERGELFLHYQPQIELNSGRIVGAEALLRWENSELGFIPPLDFIPLAEESGLINGITEWVLRTACQQNKTWQAMGLPHIRIAVNLSGCNFKQQNFIDIIKRTLESTNLNPQHLELELTENTLVHNVSSTGAALTELNAMGILISLDDFGTGYSSLSYLKKFPLAALKIDRSFVREIETDQNDAMIVRAVVALAHSLALKVVAEGVETKSQADYLRTLGCDLVQGYYFSRPVPSEVFTELLKNQAFTV